MSFANPVVVGIQGGRLSKRRLAVLLTIVPFFSLLAASIALQESRWEVTYSDGGGEYSLSDSGTSSLFVSGMGYLGRYVRVGSQFLREGLVFEISYLGEDLRGGPIAFDGRWIFVGTNGLLVALDFREFPTEGTFSNLSFVGHGGPVYIGDGIEGYPLSIRALALLARTLFVAGSVDELNPRGVVLAIDVSDPLGTLQSRSSVKVLYNLTFGGTVTDLGLAGGQLYVLENDRIHVFDVSTVPPAETRVWTTYPSSAMDVLGEIVAVATSTTNSVVLYDLFGSIGRQFTLPGIPTDIRLGDGRAFVSWFKYPRGTPGFTLLPTPSLDPGTSLELDSAQVDRGGLSIQSDGAVLVSERGMAAVTFTPRPALLVSGFMQTFVVSSGIVTAIAAVFLTPRVAGEVIRGRPQP